MEFIVDFHIHSKYSRATSPDMDLEHLDKFSQMKGIQVMGTGDFTHPLWFKEIKEKLEPAEPGLFKLKSGMATGHPEPAGEGSQNSGTLRLRPQGDGMTRFILTSEISCIYSKNGRVRKVHMLIFCPDIDAVEKINAQLSWIGNLKADGRPILGLDAKELAKIALNTNPACLVIPCHAWTPWFSVFGSKSGFDSLRECFDELTPYIFAIETGLSSDPAMNWRLSALDNIALISNSDAHSPQKIGREANIFDTELSYAGIADAIKTKDPKKFLYTIEFFPEEGKYHFDGHRLCNVSFSPSETKKYKGICPKCNRPLTIGVLNRVEELADRPEGFVPANAIPFKSLIPLDEVIAEARGVGVGTKDVAREYQSLIEKFGTEFNVLLKADIEAIKSATLPEIVSAIQWMRQGKVKIEPGYDGEYGKIKIFSEAEKKSVAGQKALF